MIGLHRSDHAERDVAGEVGRSHNLVMLDAESHLPARWYSCFGSSKGIKSHRRRPVADCMEANLESGTGPLDGHLIECGLIELGNARVRRVIHIGSIECGGSRAERTVHEAFE